MPLGHMSAQRHLQVANLHAMHMFDNVLPQFMFGFSYIEGTTLTLHQVYNASHLAVGKMLDTKPVTIRHCKCVLLPFTRHWEHKPQGKVPHVLQGSPLESLLYSLCINLPPIDPAYLQLICEFFVTKFPIIWSSIRIGQYLLRFFLTLSCSFECRNIILVMLPFSLFFLFLKIRSCLLVSQMHFSKMILYSLLPIVSW